jgi:hypothetical protein
MVSTAWSGAHDADLVCVLLDAKAGIDEEADAILNKLATVAHPKILVLNKIDGVDPLGRRRLANRFPGAVQISALTGEGLAELRARIAERFSERFELVRLLVPHGEGAKLAELYSLGTPIDEREDTEEGVLIRARLLRRDLDRHLLALLADHGDRLPDRHLTFLHRDLQQHAGGIRLDLLRDLVRVELVERLALLDLLALGLEPADDRARLHALAEPRELDLSRHGPQSS